MFTPPPLDWIEECRQSWLASKQEQQAMEASKEAQREAQRETELAFFTENELMHPVISKKKGAPAEGVSFF